VTRVDRRNLERSPGLALVAGVLDVVVGRVDLVGADQGVLPTPVLRAEASRVERPRVEARLTLDDPFGHQLAHAAGAGDAVRAEPRRDPEPRDRALTRMNSPSGVKASGPLISVTISASANSGTREIAASKSGAKRSQSGSNRRELKSGAIPLSPHTAGLRSYPPMTSPPLSARK